MGINDDSDVEASLQIGPTTEGRVRLYVEAEGLSAPMDFDPDEAEEIAEEILAAARQARNAGRKGGKGGRSRSDGGGGRRDGAPRDGGRGARGGGRDDRRGGR
ncbi:MAG: DUF6324 family protein [Pseudomonadota bacterium]